LEQAQRDQQMASATTDVVAAAQRAATLDQSVQATANRDNYAQVDAAAQAQAELQAAQRT
jgi:hypothetical protein